MYRSGRLILNLAAVAGTLFSSAALPQAFPSKPVRVVSEYGAGAGGDLFFRVLAGHISSVMGQQVLIENRAGSGGVLAMETVMRAAPDGYTLLAASQNVPITRKYLSKTGSIDVFKDLTPITAVWKTTMVITATPTLPVKSMAELIRFAKAHPGQLSYGTSGIGTQGHFAGEIIKEMAGIDMLHVPYKSNGILDTATGEIPLSISILNSAASFIRSGRIRALAVASDKRLESMPDVPTVAEVLPKFQPPPSWTALFAPAGLPKPILEKLSADVIKALNLPEARAKAAEGGFMLIGNTPEEFSAQIRRELDIVSRIVKSARIQPTN
jgi:tripartite-type tricarboxylate transporter receptor subunit TctC